MKIIILVIATTFLFAGCLYAENGNITKKQEEFVPKTTDFEKIKTGLTTEKDIIALFGEPHVVVDGNVIKENKPSLSWPWESEIQYLHIVPPVKPNQKLFGYIFPYWDGEKIILFIIIDKDKKLVEWFYRRTIRSPYSDYWFHRRGTRSPSSDDFGGGEFHKF